MCIQFGNAKSPVFMRVRRTVPQFTFSLSARFVNSLSSVSTGFFRFFSVLFENRYIFLINSVKFQVLVAKHPPRTIPEGPHFCLCCSLCLSCCHPRRRSAVAFVSAGAIALFHRAITSSSRPKLFTVSSGTAQWRDPRISSLPLHLYFRRFVFVKIPPSESNLLPSHQPLRDNHQRGIKRCRSA